MTPLQQQYNRIKKQFPDTVVFFRLGDFYETFNDDAHRLDRSMGQMEMGEPFDLEISDDELHVTSPLGGSRYQWRAFRKWYAGGETVGYINGDRTTCRSQ